MLYMLQMEHIAYHAISLLSRAKGKICAEMKASGPQAGRSRFLGRAQRGVGSAGRGAAGNGKTKGGRPEGRSPDV